MKYHLIGICGTGMAGLAQLLVELGHQVQGSDEGVYPPMSTLLDAAKIPVLEPFGAGNLDWGPDVVVVGNVCKKDHVEVLEARRRGLRLATMPEVLAGEVLSERTSIVVAGTHGKTTTTSLLAHLLDAGGENPGFFVGGIPLDFGTNARLGSGAPFVVEGDEYDTAFFEKTPKFFHYLPKLAIVTSVEFDHADIYQTYEDVVAAFRGFVERLPASGLLVASTQVPDSVIDAARCPVLRYQVIEDDEDGDQDAWTCRVEYLMGTGLAAEARMTLFRMRDPEGREYGPFRLPLYGRHNVANAAAAMLLAHVGLGVDLGELARGLATFRGVRRRQEIRGVARGVTVIDDFAHHPTAVRETLRALGRLPRGRRLVAVYEPRSNTSRRNVLQDELAEALSYADEALLGPLRRVEGIPEEERFDPRAVVDRLKALGTPAAAFQDVGRLVDYLADTTGPGDVVVVMSSGSFENLPVRLLIRLGDPVMPADMGDLDALERLLARLRLNDGDLEREFRDYLVIRGEKGLVGCIGLEVLGQYGLFKDLAVLPERRGQGLGWMLGQLALERAADMGLEKVYMFATPATRRIGELLHFRPCAPEDVPDVVRASRQFDRPVHREAEVMVRDLWEG